MFQDALLTRAARGPGRQRQRRVVHVPDGKGRFQRVQIHLVWEWGGWGRWCGGIFLPLAVREVRKGGGGGSKRTVRKSVTAAECSGGRERAPCPVRRQTAPIAHYAPPPLRLAMRSLLPAAGGGAAKGPKPEMNRTLEN